MKLYLEKKLPVKCFLKRSCRLPKKKKKAIKQKEITAALMKWRKKSQLIARRISIPPRYNDHKRKASFREMKS
jgi:hypothetical protein